MFDLEGSEKYDKQNDMNLGYFNEMTKINLSLSLGKVIDILARE